MVKPEEISDLDAVRLVRDIRKRIEEELDYPGHQSNRYSGKLVQLIMLNNKNIKEEPRQSHKALLFISTKNIAIIIFIQHLKIFLDRRIDSFDDCWDESCFF